MCLDLLIGDPAGAQHKGWALVGIGGIADHLENLGTGHHGDSRGICSPNLVPVKLESRGTVDGNARGSSARYDVILDRKSVV